MVIFLLYIRISCYLFSNNKSSTLLVACWELKEKENENTVAHYRQILAIGYVECMKKGPSCVSKQKGKINQSSSNTHRSRRNDHKLTNQQRCNIFWPIRAQISLAGREVQIPKDENLCGVGRPRWDKLHGVSQSLGQWINFFFKNICLL